MKLSEYFQYVEVSDKHYAIFNSILMQIIFIEKEKLDDVINMKVDEEEKKLLIENGIYETTSNMDEIYEYLRSGIKAQSKIPTIMYLNVSTFCNLACKYCFIESNPLSKQKYSKKSALFLFSVTCGFFSVT